MKTIFADASYWSALFNIMQKPGITDALAYDEHFKQAGFVPLLRED